MGTYEPTPSPKHPSGRRAGNSGTRDAILDAAQELFAQLGYDATSIRTIALHAGVDPGLIRYFFGNKLKLFATTMAQRTVIPTKIAQALRGDPALLGRQVTDTYLRLWDDPVTRPILLGLFRSAMTSKQAAQMLIEVLSARVRDDAPLPTPDSPDAKGFALAATHLLGVAIARHIIQLPVMVDLSHDELVDMLAPEIQGYLVDSRDDEDPASPS